MAKDNPMAASDTNGQGIDKAGRKTAEKKGFFQRLKDPEHRVKLRRTVWLSATYVALGFVIGQRGPAFLDIQIITKTETESASFFFTGGSVGYLVGSLISGVVYDKINKSVLMFSFVLGLGATTIALPFCSLYALMIGAFFLNAVFGGGLDTAGNAELLRIWGKDGEMAMQFLHFTFAFGGVISPLFTEPFLTPNPEEEAQDCATSNHVNVTTLESLSTDVHYAYIICGLVACLTALPLIAEWFKGRAQKRRQEKKDGQAVKQPLPPALFVFVLCMLCCFYLLYCAVEDSFTAYLTLFVVKQLCWSKSSGARITSVFWAAFASFRFLSIFAVRILSTVKLLFCCSLLMIASQLGFLIAAQQESAVGVWISAIMAGAAMSSVFPTGFSWMETELVRVTGRVSSAILISASSGTMINPILLGYLMDKYSNMWFPYLLLGQACLCFGMFLFLLAMSRLYLKQHYAMEEGVSRSEVIPATIDLDAPPAEGGRGDASNTEV